MADNLEIPTDLELFKRSQRSFKDTAGSSIKSDASLLGMGYVVVLIFVMVMLGKFNSVENRQASYQGKTLMPK